MHSDMASNTNLSDPLVSLLAQTKEIHELENQNLSQQQRDDLWRERVQNLTNALLGGSSPTNPTMPSPPNKSALAPSPMARAHSIAVVEPTHTTDRSPSPPENTLMSRKRSAPGATPTTPSDRLQTSALDSTSASDSFDDYTTGAASKMQRTASGRHPRGVLRIQSPSQFRGAHAQPGPLSAASSNFASPFTQSPITPYECTPPSSAPPTATFGPGPFPRAQHLLPQMDRNDSLGGPIYHRMTQMNISSNLDQRHQSSMPQLHRPAHHQQVTGTYELDPASLAPKYDSLPASPPIAIPQHPSHRSMHRVSMNGPRMPFVPSMPSSQYAPDDNRATAARMLAPRPSPDSQSSRSLSSSPHAPAAYHPISQPIKLEGGVEKYQITRLERPRVEKQKLFCDQCNKQPDGFRGAHELQRHKDAQHARVRKVWVCVDGSKDGKMLSSCKNCRAMKTYPAYYNAAAHLRRMHFKPKPEVAQKGKASRAGSGGGDDPPIEILKKFWMKQVLEIDGKIVDKAAANSTDVEEEVSSEEGDYKEEDFDTIHELDDEANEAAERAIPHLSSTIETIGSYVEVGPEEANDFADFDYDSMASVFEEANDPATNGRSMQQSICASVTSAGSNLLDAAVSFAGDLDFSELFPVPEFFPPA